jgi:hypothetical protein
MPVTPAKRPMIAWVGASSRPTLSILVLAIRRVDSLTVRSADTAAVDERHRLDAVDGRCAWSGDDRPIARDDNAMTMAERHEEASGFARIVPGPTERGRCRSPTI